MSRRVPHQQSGSRKNAGGVFEHPRGKKEFGKMLLYTKAGTAFNPVVAHLNGSSTCTGAGITARGATPVLVLCRQLLAAGLDPDTVMEVYRAGTLALRVRSLREGAKLTVKTAGNGCPIFAVDASCRGAAAPPIAQRKVVDLPWMEAAEQRQ
jgi:hypothetical protein